MAINWYLWFKSFHIISMVAWMAGLFYLPRLFVYHAENKVSSEDNNNVFKVMEYKLLYYIMIPAMVSTWIFGILLVVTDNNTQILLEPWFITKLATVFLLTAFNLWCVKIVKQFRNNDNHNSGRFFRIINEIPTIMLILTVLLVVIKPI